MPWFRSFRPKELIICTYNLRTFQYVGWAFIFPQLRCRDIHTCNTRKRMTYFTLIMWVLTATVRIFWCKLRLKSLKVLRVWPQTKSINGHIFATEDMLLGPSVPSTRIPAPGRQKFDRPGWSWPIDLEMVHDTPSPHVLYLCHIRYIYNP